MGYYRDCADEHEFAFRWRRGDPHVTTLEFPWNASRTWALDVNQSDVIVGYAEISDDGFGRLGYVLDGSDAIVLGTGPGGRYSEAVAINSQGQVACRWGPGPYTFLWYDGVLTDLTLDLDPPTCAPHDLNDAGQVVGWMGEWDHRRAFRWDAGTVVDLGGLPGAHRSQALAINNRGDVAGESAFQPEAGGPSFKRGWLWRDGTLIDLGAFPGELHHYAHDLNDLGQVVGHTSGGIPFIWQHGVLSDLNAFVRDPPPGVRAIGVWGMNNRGEIICELNTSRGGLLVPLDRPATDIDGDCRTDVFDLDFLLRAWGRADPYADLDGSGQVDMPDLLALLAGWD